MLMLKLPVVKAELLITCKVDVKWDHGHTHTPLNTNYALTILYPLGLVASCTNHTLSIAGAVSQGGYLGQPSQAPHLQMAALVSEKRCLHQ